MSNLEPQTFETQTDENGGWSYDFANNLSPGMHTMIVQDDYGSSKEVAMFVVKDDRSGLVNSITTVMPVGFAYAAMFWVLIILVLILNILHLARKVDMEEHKKKKAHYRHAIIFCAIALFFTLTVGVVINQKTRLFNDMVDQIRPAGHKYISLYGAVLDPVTLQGVAGVDLSSRNTSIHTAQGGAYDFDDLDIYYGIRVTHPNLHRPLRLIVPDQKTEDRFDIYFDPKMYNVLIDFINFSVQKKWPQAYSLLAAPSKEKITMENIGEADNTIFTEKNLTDQELEIASVNNLKDWKPEQSDIHFDSVTEVAVVGGKNAQKEIYYLVREGEEWKVVK